jgi:arylsulfatase A
MDRRTFLKAAGLGAAASSFSALSGAATSGKRPNIVLILADDLGYGHLGCYGQKHVHTPNLDALAIGGMRFTQAYAGCAQCAPSRSVLMTGLHTGHTPVRGNTGGVPLRAEDITFAKILKGSGYATGLFGKWGLGDAETTGTPNRHGFDEFFGYLHQRHAQFYYTDYLWHNADRYPLEGNMGTKREQYSQDIILDKGLEFIRTQKDAPFFCFFSLSLPHHEWTVPQDSLADYSGKFEEHPQKFRWREGYALPAEPKATMAGMISHLDKAVGRVVAELEASGLRENTLILFTSDNGPDSYSMTEVDFFNGNGGLRGYKYDLYEGGIRVPAIANWPKHIKAGKTSEHVWYFADVLPTFAEIAGAHVPENIDGLSFTSELLGKRKSKQYIHPILYWETEAGSRAIRMGQWKCVKPEIASAFELYNLDVDPSESRNVAAEHADVVETMRLNLERSHQDPPPQIEPAAPDGRLYQ